MMNINKKIPLICLVLLIMFTGTSCAINSLSTQIANEVAEDVVVAYRVQYCSGFFISTMSLMYFYEKNLQERENNLEIKNFVFHANITRLKEDIQFKHDDVKFEVNDNLIPSDIELKDYLDQFKNTYTKEDLEHVKFDLEPLTKGKKDQLNEEYLYKLIVTEDNKSREFIFKVIYLESEKDDPVFKMFFDVYKGMIKSESREVIWS